MSVGQTFIGIKDGQPWVSQTVKCVIFLSFFFLISFFEIFWDYCLFFSDIPLLFSVVFFINYLCAWYTHFTSVVFAPGMSFVICVYVKRLAIYLAKLECFSYTHA